MRSSLAAFVIAAVVTVLIGTAVRLEPYFAGDVRATRAVQAAAPNPGWWATPLSRLAPAPAKYYVMALTIVAAWLVGGWRGLGVMVVFLALEQSFAEQTKAWFGRPRPSGTLITTYGNFSGFTFPSTTITFFCVTFGSVGVLALVRKTAPLRAAALVLGFGMVALGCLARVALGAHWTSDVVLTSVICLVWIWAAARVVLGKA
jgi:membrane-associated phospholipid phosphatase